MRKSLILLCMVVAVASLGVGSGGFSSVGADRSVAVEIVEDENASMSIESANDNDTIKIKGGQRDIDFVTVTNYFSEVMRFKIVFWVNTKHSNSHTIKEDIPPGKSFSGEVTLSCSSSTGDSTSVNISFDVIANGDGVSAETTAKRKVEYTLVCKGGGGGNGSNGSNGGDN